MQPRPFVRKDRFATDDPSSPGIATKLELESNDPPELLQLL